MGLGSRATRHTAGVTPEDYWAFRPGDRVLTVEGVAGTVTAVSDGPFPTTETYEVALDGGMGGGTWGAGELQLLPTPLASRTAGASSEELVDSDLDDEDETVHTAASDYPELAEILVDRPPPKAIERISARLATMASIKIDSPLDGDQCNVCGGDASVIVSDESAPADDPSNPARWGLCDDHDDMDSLSDFIRPLEEEATGLATSVWGSLRSEAVPGSGLFWRAMDHLTKPLDALPPGFRYEPGSAYSYDWCRFRRNEHCWYPKSLNEAATQEAGYAVWIPFDRGQCTRGTWDQQKDCPMGAPGPHSGDPHALTDATVAWELGGQHGAHPSTASVTPVRVQADWDPTEHPRGQPQNAGEFSSGGNGSHPDHPPEHADATHEAAPEEPPVPVTSVDEALKYLGAGKGIMFERPQQAVVLLDKLAAIAQDAMAKGERAGVYDLCDVYVGKVSLFCMNNVNIPRSRMPQLMGKPTPGTPAAKLTPNSKGNVDLAPHFEEYLRNAGVKVTHETEDANKLRASQNELNGAKVAGMCQAVLKGTMPPGEIFISEDNYVLDGHHRWAANVGAELHNHDDIRMPVARVHLKILPLLAKANNFTHSMGLASHSIAASRAAFEFTAGWGEVRAKAKQIRSEGGVRIIATPSSQSPYLVGEVQGSHGLYQTSILRVGKSVGMWECGCPWSSYSWGRTGPFTKYEGRMCSHALALLYEAQSRGMFGRDITEDQFSPRPNNKGIQPQNYPKPGERVAMNRNLDGSELTNEQLEQMVIEEGIKTPAEIERLKADLHNGPLIRSLLEDLTADIRYRRWAHGDLDFRTEEHTPKPRMEWPPPESFKEWEPLQVRSLSDVATNTFVHEGYDDFLTEAPAVLVARGMLSEGTPPGVVSEWISSVGGDVGTIMVRALRAGGFPAKVHNMLVHVTEIFRDGVQWMARLTDGRQIAASELVYPQYDPSRGLRVGASFHTAVTGQEAPSVSGVAIKAKDTGRVLLIQRSNKDKKDPAAGTWEFPGGHMDEGESPFEAGRREWEEETGHAFPDGEYGGHWTSPNGVYQGHVWIVPNEDVIHLNPDPENCHVMNPDDPDRDDHEVAAWHDIEHLPANPALRKEVKQTPWKLLKEAQSVPHRVTAQAQSTGVMIALRPPDDVCQALLDAYDGPNPEPFSEEHITLLYLGKTDDIDFDTVERVVESFALEQQPFTGSVTGWAEFHTRNDGMATVALWNIPRIEKKVSVLRERLEAAGVAPKGDYGYIAHQTVGYHPTPYPVPVMVPEDDVSFDSIIVAYGGQWTWYELGTGDAVMGEKVASVSGPRPWYGWEWRQKSKEMRSAPGAHCEICHSRSDLTVDHKWGEHTEGGLRVLCRHCNSSRGAAEQQGMRDHTRKDFQDANRNLSPKVRHLIQSSAHHDVYWDRDSGEARCDQHGVIGHVADDENFAANLHHLIHTHSNVPEGEAHGHHGEKVGSLHSLSQASDWRDAIVKVMGLPRHLGEFGPLYHGTTAVLSPNDLLEPGHEQNFKESGQAVSLTSDYKTALMWANDVARQHGGQAHVYEVRPSGQIGVWKATPKWLGELRAAKARVLREVNGPVDFYEGPWNPKTAHLEDPFHIQHQHEELGGSFGPILGICGNCNGIGCAECGGTGFSTSVNDAPVQSSPHLFAPLPEQTPYSSHMSAKDPRFEGVGLKQDDKGKWYVHTHRARSKSYDSPEDIPQKDVDFIESTGSQHTGRFITVNEARRMGRGESAKDVLGDGQLVTMTADGPVPLVDWLKGAASGEWHNSDGLSLSEEPYPTDDDLFEHLIADHGQDKPRDYFPTDLDEIDQWHAEDHDVHGECGAHDPGLRSEGRVEADADAEDVAEDLEREAHKYEPQVSQVLRHAAQEAHGDLEGFGNRFKDRGSLVNKVGRVMAEKHLRNPAQAWQAVGDALRYTIVLPEDDYAEGVGEAIDELRKRGFSPAGGIKNYWVPGDPYDGINANMTTPDGFRWELQFHTKASFNHKESIHDDFAISENRDGSHSLDERQAAWRRMTSRAAHLPMPANVIPMGQFRQQPMPRSAAVGRYRYWLHHADIDSVPTTLVRMDTQNLVWEHLNPDGTWTSEIGHARQQVFGDTDYTEVTAPEASSFVDQFLGISDIPVVQASVREAGTRDTPSSSYGLIWDPANAARPNVLAAKHWDGWDRVPVTSFDLSEPLYATEGMLQGGTISRLIEGGPEGMRANYDPQILIDDDDKAFIIDGHHRVPVHMAFGESMPAKIIHANQLHTTASNSPDFQDFIRTVQEDFAANRSSYEDDVRRLLPDVDVVGVDLIGSYARGTPREDSDVDLGVRYRGATDPEMIATRLRGHLSGPGGVFDVVPIQITAELHDEPEPALPETDGADEPPRVPDSPSHVPEDGTEYAEDHPELVTSIRMTPTGASDIAAAASLVLKHGMKAFTPSEQRAIISEGGDVQAGNIDRLDISGTHYESLEAAMRREEELEDAVWMD